MATPKRPTRRSKSPAHKKQTALRSKAPAPKPKKKAAKAAAPKPKKKAAKTKEQISTYLTQIELLQLAAVTPSRIGLAVASVAAVYALCELRGLDSGVTAAAVVISIVCVAFMLLLGPIPQDKAYHNFADRRELCCICGGGSRGRPFLRIPNFGDVASNAPFLIVGMYGLALLHSPELNLAATSWEREVAWPVFFLGIALVSLGSAYYHWSPSNETLMWDRLPMTVAFMTVMAVMLDERVGTGTGQATLMPLLFTGVASVVYWHYTDDLRPYILVQCVPLAAIPLLILFYDPTYTGSHHQLIGLGWYALAKVSEAADIQVFSATGGRISGHTIKHLTAALTPIWLAYMLSTRKIV